MIIVIGGTSGIGLATAEYLQDQGYKTLVCGRNQPKVLNLDFYSLDILDEQAIETFFSQFDSIEGLVYSAGITLAKKPIKSFELQDFHTLMDVNVSGFLLCLKYAYKGLKKAKGKVVVVNSLAARKGSELSGLEYTISKAALSGAVKQLALECASDGILMNSVFPSMTATPMLLENISAQKLKIIEKNIPLKRVAKPLEIAKAIEFLLSDKNSYMTGAGIDMNGGIYLSS